MKQLTILFIFLSVQVFGQRFQYLNDDLRIDTKARVNNMIAPNMRIDPLFDRFGKFVGYDFQASSLRFGKSDSLIIAYIPIGEIEGGMITNLANVSGHLQAIEDKIYEMAKKYEGSTYPLFGKVESKKYLPPGDYVIDNWQTEYINYEGNWSIANENSTGCKCSFSNQAGDYVEFTFNGTGIGVLSEKVKTHGVGNIYLDGEFVKSVDFYSEYTVNPYLAYSVGNLERKQHTIKIEVSGSKNVSSSSTYVVLHGFEVTNKITSNVIISDTLFTRQDTVYIEKIVHDTVYVDSNEQYVVISNHNDIKEAYEKATGVELTRKGPYQLRMRNDSTLFIKQPDIEIE